MKLNHKDFFSNSGGTGGIRPQNNSPTLTCSIKPLSSWLKFKINYKDLNIPVSFGDNFNLKSLNY